MPVCGALYSPYMCEHPPPPAFSLYPSYVRQSISKSKGFCSYELVIHSGPHIMLHYGLGIALAEQ